MLPGNNRAKRLLVQAPMTVPDWRALGHGHFRLMPARTKCGGRNLLFLPVQNAFCTRSGIFGFSSDSWLQKMLQIAYVCTLSHSPQFGPRRERGLLTSWPTFNYFCHGRFSAIGITPLAKFRACFLHRQSDGNSNTLPGCCPRSRGNLRRLRAC
jgi:hypothetical protein